MNYRRMLTAAIVLLIMVLPNIALASTVLNVTPGLNGLYKTNQPIQLNISIANNGPAIEDALLVVKQDNGITENRSENNALYQQKVNLSANQRIETKIIIPGQMADYNLKTYLFSNGNQIAEAKIQGMAVSGDFIGISVGETPLSNGLPLWLDSNMKNMLTLKYMSPTEVPANPIALGTADLIIVDEQKVTELSVAQVSAIRQWVTLGGTLLLSGGAGAAEGQPFADISPVLANGKRLVSGNWQGLRAETTPVNVVTGTLVEGKELLKVDDVPLVARRSIGRGMVIYSAVGLGNLQAQDNKVWEALLKSNNDPVMVAKYRYDQANMMGSLINASANIPQLQLPSIKYLVGIWGLYMLLVVPGMYLLLKKYNRRDWAWLGVPAMAVVTAGIIYYSAPLHKLNGPLGQTLAIIDVLDDQVAEIRADGSYVSPKGGELLLGDSEQGLITPRVQYDGSNWQQPPVVNYGEQGVEVRYDKVGYLSLRQASLYKVVNDFGHIDGEVKLAGDKITGQLTNKTNLDIEKCLLVMGDNVVEIGDIPANGDVNVNVNVMTAKPFDWEADLKDWFAGNGDIVFQMSDQYAQTKEIYSNVEDNKGIQVIALAKDVPELKLLMNSDAENISSAVIMQKLPLSLPKNGSFRLPPGFIPATIVESNGGIEHTPEGYMIRGGQVTVEFNLQLPVQYQKFDVQAVEISNLLVESNYELSIFDWTNNKWVKIMPSETKFKGDYLKPYISNQNRLRLNIARPGDEYEVMPLPGLTVEGVVK